MTGTDRSRFPETMTGQHAGAELLPGTVLSGRFEIARMLGIGGMGVVYLARDRDLDVPVAIKLLRPELASRPEAFERFRQELLLARQVSSPHVVRIHDIARHEDRWFISMDLVDGESLDRRLDREGRLPLEPALAIARHDAGLSDAADSRAVPWAVIAGLMQLFWVGVSQRVAPRHRSGRLKQWLNYLRKVYPEAQQAFDELRLIHDPGQMAQWLDRQEVAAV